MARLIGSPPVTHAASEEALLEGARGGRGRQGWCLCLWDGGRGVPLLLQVRVAAQRELRAGGGYVWSWGRSRWSASP